MDRQAHPITHREWTEQGYLKVPARVSRIGTQQYLAAEIAPPEGQPDPGGLRERAPDSIVTVYRPPDEVFARESLASFEDVDITVDHPSDFVDADNFRRYSVGNVTSPARQEGEYAVADLLIRDAGAIETANTERAEVSAGYNARYDYEPGQAPDGTPYEYVQRNIRVNHVALVDRARAGSGARLYDHQTTGGTTMATVTLDGQSVSMPDQATAQLVQRAFDASRKDYEDAMKMAKEHEDRAKEYKDEAEKLKAEMDKAKEERDEYKEKASDAAIQSRLKEVSEVRDQALKIAGDSFTCDSLDPLTIKRTALAQSRPTIDWSNQSEEYVRAAWDLEMAKSPEQDAARSHDAFAADMARRQSNDGAVSYGTDAYRKFLAGEKQ